MSFKTFLRKTIVTNQSLIFKAYQKISDYSFSEKKKKYGDLNPDQGIYIIRRQANNVGLLSIVIVVLARIYEAENRGLIPVVDFMNYRNQYLDASLLRKENAWEYYFEQPMGISLEEAYHSKNVVLGSGMVPEYRPNDRLDFLMNVDGELDKWRELYKRYIRVQPEIQEIANLEFKINNNRSERVLGVCCRGLSYSRLQPKGHPIQPKVSDLLLKTKEMMKKDDCTKVYLSTEDGDIVNAFREYFGESLITKTRIYYSCETGFGKQYYSPKQRGVDYLVQLLMLSKCNCLVSSRCSGAVGVALMSDSFEDKFYFDLGNY